MNAAHEKRGSMIIWIYSLTSKLESGSLAFSWKAFWEAFKIRAVVVDHELLLHPTKSFSACGINPLSFPCTLLCQWISRCSGGTGGWWASSTSIGLEVSVRGGERSLSPISLDKTTSCCPVICIPQTWINPHGLVFREWDSSWFQVVEHSDWNVIHQESA